MHHLLKAYVNAKYEGLPFGNCPNCFNGVEKKSQNHVFCKVQCKDTFWTKIKGISHKARSYGRHKAPIYPGGYEQWKKDLERAEGDIAVNILLEEDGECLP